MQTARLPYRLAAEAPGPPPGRRPVVGVQARMGSTRFPGKVMASLGSHCVLDWVVTRVGRARYRCDTVVLTSVSAVDDVVERWAREHGLRCLRGSEEDVLSRFLKLYRQDGSAAVVRITADCPLVCPEVVDAVVAAWWREGSPADYASNTLRRTFPDGLDVEVVSGKVLERLNALATGSHREHVTSYIVENQTEFDCVSVELEGDCSSARVTLDTPEDLVVIAEVIGDRRGPEEGPDLEEVLEALGCGAKIGGVGTRGISASSSDGH